MLGLLGLRIFEATGANIADLGEEHGHRVLRVCGTGTHQRWMTSCEATAGLIPRALPPFGAIVEGPGADWPAGTAPLGPPGQE